MVIKTLDLELDLDPHWDHDPDPQLEKMINPDPYPIRIIKSMRIHNPCLSIKIISMGLGHEMELRYFYII
jgi:hypothetical protein